MYKRHLAFSEASERRNHNEVLYLNLFKKITTCVVLKPLMIDQKKDIAFNPFRTRAKKIDRTYFFIENIYFMTLIHQIEKKI